MGTHPPASALGSRLIQLESLHSVNWEIWFLYHPFLSLVSQQNYFHFLVCKHQAKSWIHWTCKKNYLSKLITENKNQQGPIPNFKLTLNTKNKWLSPSFWRKKPQPCEARQALFTVAAHGMVPVQRNKYICKMWNGSCREEQIYLQDVNFLRIIKSTYHVICPDEGIIMSGDVLSNKTYSCFQDSVVEKVGGRIQPATKAETSVRVTCCGFS